MATRNLVQNEQGTTMVEFALIVVVLLSIVFGIIEFGVLLFDQHVLTNASREGARAGVVSRATRLPVSDVMDVVEHYCQQHLVTFGGDALPTTVVVRSGSSFGDDLDVTVTYPFSFLVLSNFGLGPITLTAKTRMKME
ncbi:MAG: hypothetical protein B6I37_02330 [Desulfobacteraceae bacterium 4572_35.2]|nr:MAG: hypothetical protein B6I37_02330 [Desulfobacteraceae bacterium 4572_35.2]